METPKTIKVLKRDAVLPINISTGFYLRCKAVATFLVDGKSSEEMSAVYEKIKTSTVDEHWIIHLETLLVLCAEFEKQANSTGNTEELTTEEVE